MIGLFFKAAMFLSSLATNISVGLDSWVETDNEKEVNSEQDALNDILEVLKLENFKVLMEVRILCFRENKRWQQCQIIYLRAKENDVKVSLSTLMNAILRPEDIVNINKRILQRKGGMFATKESQEAFMKGYFGRGVILIAISLIKRYWWLVLRTNCERIRRGRLRRNSFTDAMEDPS